jgi:hypothetical protein
LRRARFRVDASYRTNFDAGAVVGTKFGDDVGHGILSSLSNEKCKMENSKWEKIRVFNDLFCIRHFSF